ncbi:hypothetical protein E2C01_009316 [Portunus trituberculatus]|uniref:Uncharacterized protein n=1 Tax=Portunus trituberculatus TaxID=210409 RepID=A0A5B7D4T8_PORTR|nr:hypothetical protein [Portunus trituberculatus]
MAEISSTREEVWRGKPLVPNMRSDGCRQCIRVQGRRSGHAGQPVHVMESISRSSASKGVEDADRGGVWSGTGPATTEGRTKPA